MGDTVGDCARELAHADVASLSRVIRRHEADERLGVRDAVARARRRLERHHAESDRVRALFDVERKLRAEGVTMVAGVDEVGRGAIAGPVTAGATVLRLDDIIAGLDDSKRLSPDKRSALDHVIRQRAVAVSIAHVDPQDIDRMGIVAATRSAMRHAIHSLGVAVDHVLVDGNDGDIGVPCTAIVNGDARCASIAAASVVAKVARDRLMADLGEAHPGYDLGAHKGYSTIEHMEAVRRLGPSPVHRLSFEPCRQDPRLF